ncbi:hypothetical protein OUZ56_008934 [Daphnia magna]|uniref:Uncharacterized protein n=1 Tax=Daphnia magna TaxID=35525 RepID=A0ABR0AEQ2_9CRUS|nr:hypothetical protein OUZ56_008934 [Daphnia magna]
MKARLISVRHIIQQYREHQLIHFTLNPSFAAELAQHVPTTLQPRAIRAKRPKNNSRRNWSKNLAKGRVK